MQHKHKRLIAKIRRTSRRLDAAMELVGMFFANLMFYKGRTGYIDFNVEGHEADGTIVHRKLGDNPMWECGFRIENRWVVRQGKPSPALLNEIMSQALDQGHKPAYIKWDGEIQKPYDLAPLGLIHPDQAPLPAERRWHSEVEQDKAINLRHHAIIWRA